jgi:hypothetical protein
MQIINMMQKQSPERAEIYLSEIRACGSFCSETQGITSTTTHGLLRATITDGLKLALKHFRPPIEINIKLQRRSRLWSLLHNCNGKRKSDSMTPLTLKVSSADYNIRKSALRSAER